MYDPVHNFIRESDLEDELLSYPVFMPKPSTHRMHDTESIISHIRLKSVHR
jgi:hypothetical protein